VRRFIVTALLTFVFVRELTVTARGDQLYATLGSDDFSIGSDAAGGDVHYKGTQSLHIAVHGKFIRYRASVAYTRSEQGIASSAKATYVADVLPTGELANAADDDPNYLTVLNQPFAAQLDTQTLADLRHLRKPLPFQFPSPFTGSSLHGFLEHRSGGAFGKHRSVAVRFEAAGTMRGALPDRAELVLVGKIAMRGTAYYDSVTALLLALDTTVTISGTVSNHAAKDPVRIVYTRSMRALPPP
jgi:hypothetical protein